MNTEKILYDELLSVFQLKKTGKLFVYCKGINGTTLRHGEFSVRDGQIVGVQFGEQQDSDAFSMLTSLQIHRTLFMDAVTINGSPKDATPRMADVLELLEDPSERAAGDVKRNGVRSDKVDELVQAAKQVLANVYGDKADDKVETLCETYSPEHDPIQFLHHCQKEMVDTLGLEMARELFDPVFAKARASD